MKLISLLLLLTSHGFCQVWSRLPDFPSTRRDDGVAVVVGNKAYFGTGLQEDWYATNDFYELDLSLNTWRSLPQMPSYTQRQYACAFAGNNCFYVFGGQDYVETLQLQKPAGRHVYS